LQCLLRHHSRSHEQGRNRKQWADGVFLQDFLALF
jgi:hypothetical protein